MRRRVGNTWQSGNVVQRYRGKAVSGKHFPTPRFVERKKRKRREETRRESARALGDDDSRSVVACVRAERANLGGGFWFSSWKFLSILLLVQQSACSNKQWADRLSFVTFSGSLKYSLGCLLSVFHEREREREEEGGRGKGREGTLVACICLWCFIVVLSFVKGRNCVCVLWCCVYVCVRACLCVTLLLLLQGRIRVAANGAQYGQWACWSAWGGAGGGRGERGGKEEEEDAFSVDRA